MYRDLSTSLALTVVLCGTFASAFELKTLLLDPQSKQPCDIHELGKIRNVHCNGTQNNKTSVVHGVDCTFSIGVENVAEQWSSRCWNGRWSGTDIQQDIARQPNHREKRAWWVIPALVGGALLACAIFCQGSGGGGAYVVTKYPPKFSTPCTPADVTSEYYVPTGQSSMTINWTDPVASDQDGGTPTVVQTAGTQNGGSFQGAVGGKQHLIVYQATDSDGLSGSCSFSFDVIILTCGAAPWVSNSVLMCPDGLILGAACSYNCETGYQMTGNQTVTCENEANPNWTTAPTCEEITCANAPILENGSLSCDGNTYRSRCLLLCDTDFALEGETIFITCQADSTWTSLGGSYCRDDSPPTTLCLTPQIFYADRGTRSTAANWVVPTAEDNIDASPTVIQTEGPTVGSVLGVGVTLVKYKSVDSAGLESPECSMEIRIEVITCGHPLDALNESRIMANCTDTGYTWGTECTIDCQLNLPLEGTNLLTCESQYPISGSPVATWSWGSGTQQPYCRDINCPELDAPINGALVYDTIQLRPVYTMFCNEDFDIPARISSFAGLFLCTDDGDWSPISYVPDCTEPRSPRYINLPAELLYYTGDCGTEQAQEDIRAKFDELLAEVAEFFQTICPSGQSCSVTSATIVCGAVSGRKRREVREVDPDRMKTIQIKSSERKIRDDHKISKRQTTNDFYMSVNFGILMDWLPSSNMSLSEAFGYYDDFMINDLVPAVRDLMDNDHFNMTSYGLTLDGTLATANYGNLNCEEGYILDQVICKPCPLGHYLAENDTCIRCPLGTYVDTVGATVCTSCPDLHSTMDVGSKSIAQCLELCIPGYHSPSGMKPCSTCGKGNYSTEYGGTSCMTCPPTTTTLWGNSSDISDCQSFDVQLKSTTGSINLGEFTSDITDLSIAMWIKRVSTSVPNIHFRLVSGGTIVAVIYLTDTVRVEIPSLVDEVVSNISNSDWIHVVMTMDSTSSLVTVYVSGQQPSIHNVNVANPVISGSGSFILSAEGDTGVYLSGLHVTPSVLSETDVQSLLTLCEVTVNNDIFNMGVFLPVEDEGVTVLVPSACDAINECSTDPCNGHKCINGIGLYTCICSGGYSGDHCEVLPDFCIGNACENGATCISELLGYTCTCEPGYSGSFCEIPPVDGNWSDWTEWSQCTKECDTGTRMRNRSCDSPVPDQYGSPCVGDSSQVEDCNTEACPSCPTLERRLNTIKTCDDVNVTTGDVTCRLTCNDGEAFATGLADFTKYRCGPTTNYVWMNTSNTVACGAYQRPDRYSIDSNIDISPPVSDTDLSSVAGAVVDNAQDVPCVNAATCSVSVTLSDNASARKRRSTVSTLTLTFSIELQDNSALQVADFIQSSTVSSSLQEIIDAINSLETAGAYVEDNVASIFDITSGGVTYTSDASRLVVNAIVTCPSGQAATDGLCVECPAGTYLINGVCSFCDKGTYQTQSGQTYCEACPTGYTTTTIGSDTLGHCSVFTTSPATSDNTGVTGSVTTEGNNGGNGDDTSDEDSERKKIYIGIGLSAAAFVLSVLAISCVVYYKYNAKTRRVNSADTRNQRFNASRLSGPRPDTGLSGFLPRPDTAVSVTDLELNGHDSYHSPVPMIYDDIRGVSMISPPPPYSAGPLPAPPAWSEYPTKGGEADIIPPFSLSGKN